MSPKKLILPPKNCLFCGVEFTRESCNRVSDYKEKKFCSRKCYVDFYAGDKHWNWSGGIRKRSDGYLRDDNDNYIHRLVMEQYLGRKLLTSEHIHHINGDPSDNRIENLLLVSNSEHRKIEVMNQKRGIDGKFITQT